MEKNDVKETKTKEKNNDFFFLRIALSMAAVMIYFAAVNTDNEKSEKTARYIEAAIQRDSGIDVDRFLKKLGGNSDYVQNEILKLAEKDDIYKTKADKFK